MLYRNKVILFTLFTANLIDQYAQEVTIEQGTLSGKISGDGTFMEYVGIPYASTNSSTRFQAPGPPPSWSGVFKAVDEKYLCPQLTSIGVIGTEDCLKINVYVPETAKKPLPVMIFIHGGAFIKGSGGKLMYGPDFLVHKGVILVTFNYRLGALGFLCLNIKEVPGNAGLKDQLAALRWVKKNIAAFGGDPENITVFGVSAGAASTSLLLASNHTKGLITRAIVQSGSSVSNWAINRNPVWAARLLAKSLGHDTEDPLEMYNIFSQMPYDDLILAKVKKPLSSYMEPHLLHLPCMEKIFPGEEYVIDDLPYNLLEKKSESVTIIYGSTSKEGFLLVADETEESLEQRNGRYLFDSDLRFPSEIEAAAQSQEVQKFYFSEERISKKAWINVTNLYTHLYFEVPSILETDVLIKRTNATLYNYYFDYSGDRNLNKMRLEFGNETGASHGDDMFYLFNGTLLPFHINSRDHKMIETMTTLWTNFAKYGDPTPKSNDRKVQWVPSTKERIKFLYIKDELKMGPVPNPTAYHMWKSIYEKYRKKK